MHAAMCMIDVESKVHECRNVEIKVTTEAGLWPDGYIRIHSTGV